MTKHTSYFSHDSNSRNDEKILALRMRHGAEGYGVYFMILERLREEDDYTITKDYNTLAFDFRVSSALIKSVVEDFRLFHLTPDGHRFYSQSFMDRMQIKDASTRRRSEAGRKGMQARWGNTPDTESDNNAIPFDNNEIENNNNATRTDNNVITPQQKNITSKENKTKQIKTKEEKEENHPMPMLTLEQVEKYLQTDRQWQQIICMQNNLTEPRLAQYIAQFANLLRERGETHKTAADAKSHFVNWLKIQIKEQYANPTTPGNTSADKLQRDLAHFAHTHVGK